MKINPYRRLLILFVCLSQMSFVWADTDDAFQFFQDEAKVVTASRREQSIKDVPMAVDVITADEIKASGATTISDLMRFRVGMDVLDARATDGSRSIVSVRGFPQEFVHNLQVLVDGRSVYEPISGSTFWDRLPISMDDIERIEIIRGPNAALYGSGAGLGVINIITKKPEGPTMVAVKTMGGNGNMVQTSESIESSVKNVAYRISHTFDQQEGFPLASGADNGTDFLHSNKANARINWTPVSGSNLELFTGGSWENDGVPNDLPQQQTQYDEHFEMLKFSQKVGSQSTVELLSSRNNYITDQSPAFPSGTGQFSVLQYDEELLQRWAWADDRLNTTYGVNYRNAAANSPIIFAGAPDQVLELWSGYFNQSMQLAKTVSVTGGASWESSGVGQGGLETNYQAASLWAPLENHSFWASYSVAHTVPSLFTADAHDQFNQVVLSQGNPDLKPQTLTSYEIGHRGTALDKHMQMDTNLYYTVIRNIDSNVVQSAVFFPQPAITLTSVNNNQAIARGVETEVKYRFDPRRSVYLNYTYEHVSDWINDQGSVTRNTPTHKVNLGGIADLGHGFSGSVNLGYKDNYFIRSIGRSDSAAIPAYWRLDARLAYALNHRVELFIAGQNLAAHTHIEFADGLTVPRTYEGGVSVKWGGHS